MRRLSPRKLALGVVGISALLVTQQSAAINYSPAFNPANFSHPLQINNLFFTLQPNTTQLYRGKSVDGCELDRMNITDDSRVLGGIRTRVVHDVVFEDPKCNGHLNKVEDTLDYYAQDNRGNVWYMGEISKDCDGDNCTLNEGSWLPFQDIFHTGHNAQPGIQMPADPEDNLAFREEFYAGHAEDQAVIAEDGVTVNLQFPHALPPGTFAKCIKVKEFTRLEPGVVGYKFYCPNVGLVLETEQPGNFRSERVTSY